MIRRSEVHCAREPLLPETAAAVARKAHHGHHSPAPSSWISVGKGRKTPALGPGPHAITDAAGTHARPSAGGSTAVATEKGDLITRLDADRNDPRTMSTFWVGNLDAFIPMLGGTIPPSITGGLAPSTPAGQTKISSRSHPRSTHERWGTPCLWIAEGSDQNLWDSPRVAHGRPLGSQPRRGRDHEDAKPSTRRGRHARSRPLVNTRNPPRPALGTNLRNEDTPGCLPGQEPVRTDPTRPIRDQSTSSLKLASRSRSFQSPI